MYLLAQGTEPKRFFPRTVQYRARLKVRTFEFFWALWDIFFEKKCPTGPPSFFSEFRDRMDVEKSQRAPFHFFRHCETFKENFHQRITNSPAL